MAIRFTVDADIAWIKALVDAAHSQALIEEQVQAMLADPQSVCYGNPDTITFCRCVYRNTPRDHAVAAGMSTQVALLLPLRLDVDYLRNTIMPLLAKTWYEVGVQFPDALANPLWAQGNATLASRFETIIGTTRSGRVLTLPTLQEGIDKVAEWL